MKTTKEEWIKFNMILEQYFRQKDKAEFKELIKKVVEERGGILTTIYNP